MNDPALRALTLYRLGKLVNSSLDLDETLNAIVDAAHELLAAESTAILLQESGEHLVIRAGRGAAVSAVGERVPIGAGVVGRALIEGRPIVIDDMQTEPGRARPDLDARSGIRAYMAAPLVWRGDCLGVITVAAMTPSVFSKTESDLASELAEQAAAAVAHARAYTEELARREELEAMNLALQRAQERLVQVEKLTAIGHLAHGIAHEMNTPLGVIISNLSVLDGYGQSLGRLALVSRQAAAQLNDGQPPAVVVASLESALQASDLDYILDDLPALTGESTASANRIADIVRSVALLARGNSSQLVSVNVEDTLQAAITLAWNELKQNGDVKTTFGAVPPVVGNPSELTQVFVHLLLNAAQALPERGGVVAVSTAVVDGSVTIRISDNGVGIPLEQISRVFEPFFTTRSVGEGSGLGLSICHGIITRHKGSIDLQSLRNSGTTVTVRLAPAVPA